MTINDSVLIIDDKPDNIHLLAQVLQEEGFHVRSSTNADHALMTIYKKKPDIILLDIMMPGVDGFELCKTIKQDSKLNDIPIIFLSALDDLENKLTGFDLGGIDYITKPFHIDEIVARVKIHLQLRKKNRSLNETPKYEKSNLSERQKENIQSMIIDLMDRNHPYLSSEFSIDKMARSLNISRHNISEVINQKLNKNFNSFVNEYRIYYIIKEMSKGKHKNLTLLGLALEAGFNSKSTFNAVFKKIIGFKPSEYLTSIESFE
jgi:DNA-binding response OmpR family regulator